MANTKTITLEAAVKNAASMSVAARPGYGQSNWVEARASLQVLVAKVAREWAALQGRTVGRAEMSAKALDLIQQELATRAANLRDYRAACEAARLAAQKVAAPAHRKAAPQAAFAQARPAHRKAATPVTLKATAAKAAVVRKAKAARPAMDLEELVAAGFARQAAKVAEKAGAAPAEIKVVRKAAKAVAKAAAKAAKAAKKEAQAAFRATKAATKATKTKGRKA